MIIDCYGNWSSSFCLCSLCSVIGYTLLLSLIEYKTLVMRGALEQANQILPSIPKEQLNRYLLLNHYLSLILKVDYQQLHSLEDCTHSKRRIYV